MAEVELDACPECGHAAPHSAAYGCNEHVTGEALCPCWAPSAKGGYVAVPDE